MEWRIDGKRLAASQGDTNQPYCFILLKGNIAVLIRGEDQLEKEVAQMGRLHTVISFPRVNLTALHAGEGAVVGEVSRCDAPTMK